jgi:FkbM family methyltransferase
VNFTRRAEAMNISTNYRLSRSEVSSEYANPQAKASMMRSALRTIMPFPMWQTAGFISRIPSYWRLDRSEALRIRRSIPGLPLHVTKDIHVFSPESVTALRCWQYHGVEINDSSAEVADFITLCKDRRALIDIGAQTGFISALFARSRPGPCRILSVEPDPRMLPMLGRAVELNGAACCNWTIRDVAVSDRSGTISIPTCGLVYEPNANDAMTKFEAHTVTLDALLSDLDWKPDIIKIDVESFEHEILTSSLDTIDLMRPALQLEVHWQMLSGRRKEAMDFLKPLADMGYRGIRKRYGTFDKWSRAGSSEPVSRLALTTE